MSVARVLVDGQEYPIAPLEPERWDHPSPAYPVAVTPEVARHWLRYNYRNRTQREAGKKDYSADMRTGNFDINGATVSFTRPHREGEDELVPTGAVAVLDGQHRLESCAASGSSFVTYVAYGLAPRVRHTVDTGIKRSFGDVLHMRGERNSIITASVVQRCYSWEQGNQHLNMKKGGKTHSLLLDFFLKHPEINRSVDIAVRAYVDFEESTRQPLRRSVVGLAHWLFMGVDETVAPEFFARVGDGATMEKHDPIMALRRRLVKDLTVKKQMDGDSRRRIPKVEDWEYLCYFIRTWNARLEWLLLTEEEQEKYSFMLLGPKDNERIPTIKTPQQALDEAAKRLSRNND